ncbi:MAG: peptidase dipeptidylpeptidase domain protein, partial [Marmoricola sp.]|nr:peptidase dipeptidylpeptidase domain protein [Marmoricola sp.]
MKQVLKTIVFTFISFQIFAQIPANFQWLADGSGFRDVDDGEIIEVALPSQQPKIIVSKVQLTPAGRSEPLSVRSYTMSKAGDKV